MADNFQGTAFGGGAVDLATKEIGGVHVSKMLAVKDDGTAAQSVDDLIAIVAETNARIAHLVNVIGHLSPDTAGRLRVTAEVVAAHAVTLASLATVTTVTTVSTVTNQAQIGGLSANQAMIALMLGNEGDLRRNVVIS